MDIFGRAQDHAILLVTRDVSAFPLLTEYSLVAFFVSQLSIFIHFLNFQNARK